MDKTQDARPTNYRWNFIALLLDYVFFSVAISFINPNTVLPIFVGQFTRSAPIIGLVSTVWSGCWLLPQVISARVINDKPRKKPYLLAGLIGRFAFWIVAVALWSGLYQQPNKMLVLFFATLGLFTLTDGFTGIAWFDIVARAVPLKRRGRLFGTGQVISGIAGLGVGAVLSLVLDSPKFPFPTDYVLIFALAGIAFVPSTVALTLLRETRVETDPVKTGSGQHTEWLKPLLHDTDFRRLMICRILVGMVSLATPFYVVHATDELNLSVAVVGSFVATQQIASVAFGALLGMVSDHGGPTLAIRIGSAASVAGPLFALSAHLADGGLLVRAYPIVYIALGAYQTSLMLGFYNYLLEIAPDDLRPSYIGLGNTIMGILTLAPIAGGWLLERTSYTLLFALTGVLASFGTLTALRLKPAMEMRSSGETS